jgi:hypothetical protein
MKSCAYFHKVRLVLCSDVTMANKEGQVSHAASQLDLAIPHRLHDFGNRLQRQLPHLAISNLGDNILTQLDILKVLNLVLASRPQEVNQSELKGVCAARLDVGACILWRETYLLLTFPYYSLNRAFTCRQTARWMGSSTSVDRLYLHTVSYETYFKSYHTMTGLVTSIPQIRRREIRLNFRNGNG